MEPISALIDRSITFKATGGRRAKVEILTAPICPRSSTRPARYEADVFNCLLANKGVLGIETVSKFTNLLLDGQIVLCDGRRVVIEIKLRMNWLKACQSEYQFRQFLKRGKLPSRTPVSGGIVFFEDFSSDWARPVGGIIRGWKHWYRTHSDVEGLRVDLIRLRGESVETCPRPARG
jgi:hypothetical protein